jgi:hypothetical protein
MFSPDGRWVAYVSNESGTAEVYVRPFPSNVSVASPAIGTKWMISRDGGTNPRWRHDGKELYYLTPNRELAAVEVTASPDFHTGAPKILFQAPPTASWDVSPDGNRFLLVVMTDQGNSPPFTVVLNWIEELKQRVSAK